MARLLQIAQLGQPILRKKAKPVEDILSQPIQDLIDDLITTVIDVDGVGIAAVQVYESKRLFIMASHPNIRYPKAPNMPPTPVINPTIDSHSQETENDWEGCLSIPQVRAIVPRWKNIKVSYYTREGKRIQTEYEGFVARIFQHEYDHLDGLVFLDRIETTKNIYMEKEYQKIIAKKK